jgi:hypothetical protein
VASNLAYKFDPDGRLQMVLGVKGHSGEWHPFGHLRLLHEPNEAVVGPRGDIFVLQGHGKAESLVLKFDHDGNFIKSWGGKGSGPGQLNLPHSLVFDAQGLLYIADRNNARIQVFDADGNYIRESQHPGTPCGLFMGADQHIWLAHGHTGQIMKLDLNGTVVGGMADAGTGKIPGKYGEAHYIAVSPRDEVFVADTLNWRVHNFVRKLGVFGEALIPRDANGGLLSPNPPYESYSPSRNGRIRSVMYASSAEPLTGAAPPRWPRMVGISTYCAFLMPA